MLKTFHIVFSDIFISTRIIVLLPLRMLMCDAISQQPIKTYSGFSIHILQGDQLNMTVFSWYFVKSDLISYANEHVTGHFLQGTRKDGHV